MINNMYFTDKEIDTILKESLVILYDTREQKGKNDHILNWCAYKDRVETKRLKLPTGDYSVMLKANPEFGLVNDIYFTDEIAIERKSGLEELSGNLTTDRKRFEYELLRSTSDGIKFSLAIEDSRSKLYQGTYNTKYNRKSFIASIATFENRYSCPFQFFTKEEIPVHIFTTMYYYVRERLK